MDRQLKKFTNENIKLLQKIATGEKESKRLMAEKQRLNDELMFYWQYAEQMGII